jgi:hypothetical protein
MYIHVRIPFNFTTVFNTKQAIAGVYNQLLEQPFKSITKSVTDISLSIIEGSLEDFHDILKALPQKTVISITGPPKDLLPSASPLRQFACPLSTRSDSPS